MSRKNRQRRKRTQSKLSKVISHARDGKELKYNYFSKLSVREIKNNFPKIANNYLLKDTVYLSKLGNCGDIYKFRQLPDASLEKNISWCVGLVLYHRKEISDAIVAEKKIFLSINQAEYLQAISELNQIDKNCGVSVWSLTIRRAIENLASSEIPIEDKASKVLEGADENRLLNFILNYSADYFRDEDIYFSTTNTFAMDITRSFVNPMHDFLFFKLLPFNNSPSIDFGSIITIERESSIMDVFFLLVNYLSFLFSPVGRKHFNSAYTRDIVLSLSKEFDYEVLRGLANIQGVETEWSLDEEVLDIMDMYTAGRYSCVCERITGKSIFTYDFSILELIAKADIRCSKLLLESDDEMKIVRGIQNVLLRNDDYYGSLQMLACRAHKLYPVSWCQQLANFVKRESPFVSEEYENYYAVLNLIFRETCSPVLALELPHSIKDKYLDKMMQLKPNSLTIQMVNELANESSVEKLIELGVDESRAQRYESAGYVRAQDYSSALRVLRSLINSSDRLVSNESKRSIVKVLLLSGEYDEAVTSFVDFALAEQNIATIFDTHRLISESEGAMHTGSSIDVPIAYSLHSRYVDSNYDSALRFAFQNFLQKNNCRFPQDLFGRESEFGKMKLLYFLKWVCTPYFMRLYLNFDSQREIEDCRLSVCAYLIDSGDQSESLQLEVRDITKSHIIKKAAKKIHNSRIYVDASSFSGRESQKYKSAFKRYIELSAGSFDEEEDEQSLSSIVDLFKKTEGTRIGEYFKQLSIIHLPNISLNDKNRSFMSLANLFRSEFTYGDKGLNSHLSTRIRHGFLPTEFRKPITDEGLFVLDKSELDSFFKESIWSNGTSKFAEQNQKKVFEIILNFSKKYEELILEINDQWLQIYTLEQSTADIGSGSGSSNGMFDYSISAVECFALQRELPISPSYAQLVKTMMSWLWSRTEFILTDVQERIRGEAKDRATLLLESLKKEVSDNVDDPMVSELCNAVDRSKSSLSNQVMLIASWFTNIDPDEDDDEFDFETAVQIARTPFNLDVDFSNSVEYLFGNTGLTCLVDVFSILFENAVSKANMPKKDLGVVVKIDANEEGQLEIFCQNRCNVDVEFDQANADLQVYREAYGNQQLIRDKVQNEGGTGFFKIWKILELDLEAQHSIEFGFIDAGKFEVCIQLKDTKHLRVQ